ncbi:MULTISPECIES: GNAT family N-acetyltransferase [Auritidibacter]|uniref:GNAT family N-acetyltransferase n=1 Tax=Auritidibacter ignavus TaxID=678932 RepID=A0AAJ6AIS0_9MICC|nr:MULTISPECIES: GNAT family N-acetyltransferase [Auritidibacter]WGH91799.1 GNAT family N-acetyltransferase [Auritidibacter ignavus]WGH94248.1 GNAT family N-acetyltransferase [Auritidibacter ignavus]WHS27461.1 GNAT family N-acetyltransferase [Auritidibacter ignavus]
MIQIRTATEDDFAAISDQRVRSYLDGGHLRPEDSYVETLADVAAHASELLKVAVDSAHPDQVLGSVIMVRPEDDASETARPDEREFRMLVVAPEARRRGVGAALVTAVLDWAEREGARAVSLTTLQSMTEAHRLYERLGFRRAPERDWSLSDIGLADPVDGEEVFLVYVRPLSAETTG